MGERKEEPERTVPGKRLGGRSVAHHTHDVSGIYSEPSVRAMRTVAQRMKRGVQIVMPGKDYVPNNPVPKERRWIVVRLSSAKECDIFWKAVGVRKRKNSRRFKK